MKKLFLIMLLFLLNLMVKGQGNPFQRVNIPDSIYSLLEEAYSKNAKNVNAGHNVFNLSNRKDFIFKNGIFSFQGQGAHFPKRIFVFNNGKIFIFKNEGAFNPKGTLYEFLNCIDSLSLTNKQMIRYLRIVSQYLQNEEGLTYGDEIKN